MENAGAIALGVGGGLLFGVCCLCIGRSIVLRRRRHAAVASYSLTADERRMKRRLEQSMGDRGVFDEEEGDDDEDEEVALTVAEQQQVRDLGAELVLSGPPSPEAAAPSPVAAAAAAPAPDEESMVEVAPERGRRKARVKR